MIRRATTDNTREIVSLLGEFLRSTSYHQGERAANNFQHLCKLTWMVLQHGYIWISYSDSKPVGLLMAIREPNMWLPEVIELRELVFFVLPESRSGTHGGRLFKTFCDTGDQLIASGDINVYFTTKMTTTEPYDLERRGFRLTELTYIKE